MKISKDKEKNDLYYVSYIKKIIMKLQHELTIIKGEGVYKINSLPQLTRHIDFRTLSKIITKHVLTRTKWVSCLSHFLLLLYIKTDSYVLAPDTAHLPQFKFCTVTDFGSRHFTATLRQCPR